ncbi:hypothetical protein M2140_001670 [Clostridiales Family XIII bacterium PM5-7]
MKIDSQMLKQLQSDSLGGAAKVYVCHQGESHHTQDGADLRGLTEADIIQGDDGSIEAMFLNTNGENKALICSNTPYCHKCNKEKKTIESVLDDMAQIIGYQAKVVPYERDAIFAALEKSAACLVEDRYTICVGRTLFEAVTALNVLEKSAEVMLKAEVLGGGKIIPVEEAQRMRHIYQESYSKIEQSENHDGKE